MTRVTVFIDYQNAYMRARERFGHPGPGLFTFGQIDPRRLGLLLEKRGHAVDPRRRLSEVRVYRGEPDRRRNPTAHAACRRQIEYWAAQEGVSVITRPLLYRPIAGQGGGPRVWEGREKGIDVHIALDMAMGAVRDAFDVAILMSADTDLVPAIEAVLEAGKRAEVAAWDPHRGAWRLSVPGRKIWCHWLGRADFDRVSDPTDYTKAATTRG